MPDELLDKLATQLQETGTATLHAGPGRTPRECRNVLVEVAQLIDVRIKMKRYADPERVTATALTPEEASRQMERDFCFRIVNDMRGILGDNKRKLTQEESEDLNYIADDLEDYAREIGGGDEESLLSFLKRHLLGDE